MMENKTKIYINTENYYKMIFDNGKKYYNPIFNKIFTKY